MKNMQTHNTEQLKATLYLVVRTFVFLRDNPGASADDAILFMRSLADETTVLAAALLIKDLLTTEAKNTTVRRDRAGRDVTDLPGLWDESDTLEGAAQ